jgi:hypothetical protein
MAVIAGTTGRTLSYAGVPGAGTDEVQTLTIGGTPTSGTFSLAFEGATTAPITWSATNTTLRDNVDTALEALRTVGTGNVTTAVGTMTAGIGTLTITFAGALGKKAVPLISVADNSLAGTAPTVAVEETTPGVDATERGTAKGGLLIDTTNGVLYINTGTANAPTWTKVGTQS